MTRMLQAAGRRLTLMTVIAAALSGCAGQQVLNAFTPQRGLEKAINLSYGDHPRQRMDIYSPAGASEAPVVVFFYGGSWREGSKDLYEFVAQALTSRGFVAVVPDYRVYPDVQFPAFVEDAAGAVAQARQVVHRYGGDPDKLFIMGHSAGAHLAAMLATDGRYLQAVGGSRAWLRGFIGLSGPYDFTPIKDSQIRAVFGPESEHEKAQPVNYVDGQVPPTLLLHGENDTVVYANNSRDLAQRIAEEGGRPTLVIYPKMSHQKMIAVFGAPLRGLSDAVDKVASFIREQARKPRSGASAGPAAARPAVSSDYSFETRPIDDEDPRPAETRPEPVEP